jgi:hypothetical protein
MTQLVINIGTDPSDPNADTIRTAFEKVNTNFSAVFNSTNFVSVGSFQFNNNVLSTSDGSPIILSQSVFVTSDLVVEGDFTVSGLIDRRLDYISDPQILGSGISAFVDTSLGSYTLSLPEDPELGSTVTIVDPFDWKDNNLIIDRNGSTIENIAENLIVDIGKIVVNFFYTGETWKVYTSIGPRGPVGPQGPGGTAIESLDGGSAITIFGVGDLVIDANGASVIYGPEEKAYNGGGA